VRNRSIHSGVGCTGITGVQGRFNPVTASIREWKGVSMPLSRRTLWIGAALAALVAIVVLAVVFGGGGGGGGIDY
jgi:hypothetical protein